MTALYAVIVKRIKILFTLFVLIRYLVLAWTDSLVYWCFLLSSLSRLLSLLIIYCVLSLLDY